MNMFRKKALLLAPAVLFAVSAADAWAEPAPSSAAPSGPTIGVPSGLTPVQERNIARIRGGMSANQSGQGDRFDLFHENDFTVYESTGLPYGGTYHGASGVREIVRKMGEFWSSVTPISINYIPYGDDKVLVHSIARRTVRSTGKELEMHTMGLWQFKNDKASSVRVFFFDTRLATDLAKAP